MKGNGLRVQDSRFGLWLMLSGKHLICTKSHEETGGLKYHRPQSHTMSEGNWMDDAEVMRHLDDWLSMQNEPLNRFMSAIIKYADETPLWALTVCYSKFVVVYNQLRNDATEIEAFNEALARLANDPLVNQLVSQMMGDFVNQAGGLNDR